MEQNTELRNKSKQWWFGLDNDQKKAIVQKYYNDSRGIPAFTYPEIDELYISEHPTETETSKEVTPKLVQWVESNCPPLDLNAKPGLVLELVTAYKQQKEKDRELISELLDIVKEYNKEMTRLDTQRQLNDNGLLYHLHIKSAITKAEKHLNNQ